MDELLPGSQYKRISPGTYGVDSKTTSHDPDETMEDVQEDAQGNETQRVPHSVQNGRPQMEELQSADHPHADAESVLSRLWTY